MNDLVLFDETNNGLGLITLNRQQALNALNHEMFKALDAKLAEWAFRPAIKAVLIKAAPGRAFSAGGDIRSVYENKRADDHSPALFLDEYQLNRRIFHYPKPYIALLDGITMGGGAGVSVHGSYRVATERLVFAMPETAIGFFPDIGASYFLSRLPYKIGRFLGLTAERANFSDCFALGLVDAIIASDAQEKWFDEIKQAGRFDNDALNALTAPFLFSPSPAPLYAHRDEIAICFAKNKVEDILQALQKMGTDWCLQTADTIKKRSPMSLKVTLEELLRAEKLDFDACMDMEERIMRRFMQSPDFVEGIRAAVIDKDQRPVWCPAKLEKISENMVEDYF